MQNQLKLDEETPVHETSPQNATSRRPWNPVSLAVIFFLWLILQIGGLFTPGLLDDVDSIYIEIAREMLQRHDYVTPYIDGVRFFDKPPLMYWMAAGSMRLFGIHDWAARLPLALAVLVLLLAVYALGIRLFATVSPAEKPDRGAFYAAIALATSIGPYLYTRFYIPDILIALWMTLAVHLFLIALDRLRSQTKPQNRVPHSSQSHRDQWVIARQRDPLSSPSHESPGAPSFAHFAKGGNVSSSALLPCLAFAAVMALNVLTKGLIGLVFPIAFVLLYLAITRQLHLLPKLHLIPSTLVFLAIAAPWHILAALRNPAISMPPGLGLPAKAGWAWFYLYNEHIARFLSKRIPHDYGQTPVLLFWIYLAIWIMPWTVFLPGAIADHIRTLRHRTSSIATSALPRAREHEASLCLLLWSLLVMGFFSLSSRQEYYSIPAIPALCLMAGGLLARADQSQSLTSTKLEAASSALRWHLCLLLPLSTAIAMVCAYFALTAPHPAPGTDLASLLNSNPDFYNLSLGHLFDLTGDAMGLFRGPLTAVALSMLGVGLVSYLLRRRSFTYAANLVLATAMTVSLLAAHEGLVRFYPVLGSKNLALTVKQQLHPGDRVIIDGWLSSGSSLLFYTGQQAGLVNGRIYGPWYGSFWPDAPPIFGTDDSLRQAWPGPQRIFLLTFSKQRAADLARFAPVHLLATEGGKFILSNR
ncbi:ArnT family glycosyltransferase [Tunturibacter empetritectus]|uniref:4-amino-4-deoxy-L-arabinose transferase-like glycosyltransferase n=1 Tax=Tunturiibacter empetritectus TaxID=3069691 RepID=A0A7W8IIL5_9BACT|nr:4-amino-4-deoxy-L-arabinose transferase-like glycosyltransferase [Edaphobacter lichenicola]